MADALVAAWRTGANVTEIYVQIRREDDARNCEKFKTVDDTDQT